MRERQSEKVAFRFTPSELRMLDELAEWTHRNRTDVARAAVRAMHGEEVLRGHRKARRTK